MRGPVRALETDGSQMMVKHTLYDTHDSLVPHNVQIVLFPAHNYSYNLLATGRMLRDGISRLRSSGSPDEVA